MLTAQIDLESRLVGTDVQASLIRTPWFPPLLLTGLYAFTSPPFPPLLAPSSFYPSHALFGPRAPEWWVLPLWDGRFSGPVS